MSIRVPAGALTTARIQLTLLAVILCTVLLSSASAQAGAEEHLRVAIGLKLFRATLAADLALSTKTDSQGRLLIVLSFATDEARAKRHQRKLMAQGGLLDYPLRVVLSSDPTLSAFEATPPAGVLVTERAFSKPSLQHLQDFCNRHARLLFSPFESHVEHGVASGLFIGARVQPYINLPVLRASGVRLKDFFMQVVKPTEPLGE